MPRINKDKFNTPLIWNTIGYIQHIQIYHSNLSLVCFFCLFSFCFSREAESRHATLAPPQLLLTGVVDPLRHDEGIITQDVEKHHLWWKFGKGLEVCQPIETKQNKTNKQKKNHSSISSFPSDKSLTSGHRCAVPAPFVPEANHSPTLF